MSDPTSPVDTARSIAIPMTTGTSASPTKCPTIRAMPGSVYFPAPKMARMTNVFGVVSASTRICLLRTGSAGGTKNTGSREPVSIVSRSDRPEFNT